MLALTLASAALSFAVTAPPAQLRVAELSVEGAAQDVLAADLDGDGWPDLLVASVSRKRRLFSLFWNRDGAFTDTPNTIVTAPLDLGAFDVADLGDGAQLLGFTATGVNALSLRGRKAGEWRRLATEPTLFLAAPERELTRWRGFFDLGGPRLIIPGVNVLALYDATAGALRKRGSVAFALDTKIVSEGRERDPKRQSQPTVTVEAHVPALHAVDMNGDGKRDLVLVQGEHLTAFAQTASGDIATTPIAEHRFALQNGRGDAEIAIILADVDGDGRADVVASKETSAGVMSASSSVFFFKNRPEGFAAAADQLLSRDGASLGSVQVTDLTGDGHPDLLFPAVKIGLFQIVRMLTSKTVKVDFALHPFVGEGFTPKPGAQRDLTFALDLGENQQTQIVDMFGDYDGDGRNDLALGTGDKEVSFFSGAAPGELFAERPFAKATLSSKGRGRPMVLSPRGPSSLVVFYQGSREQRSTIAVVSPP